MVNNKLFVSMTIASFALLAAAPAKADNTAPPGTAPAPATSPLPMPQMAGPLGLDTTPYSFNAGPLNKIYVGGVASAMGWAQDHATAGDKSWRANVTNAQVFVQNTEGPVQFYLQAGAYDLPALGTPYLRTLKTTADTYGYLPQGYLKYAPNNNFSVMAGKLPTLIGDEYTFTFQNMNIERGQLWNIEPLVSRGVQVNWSNGPLSVSFSWNDGTYSNVLNSLSGLVSYGFNGGADTVAFAASGNLGNPGFSALNSGSVYNLIWTHTSGNWTITPYLQYNDTPAFGFGVTKGSTTFGGAILASYSFTDHWKMAGRVEYVSESGHQGVFTTTDLLGYGPGSNAVTVTLTPSYQWKNLYARVDASYISLGSASTGFGTAFNQTDQFRGVLEIGVLF